LPGNSGYNYCRIYSGGNIYPGRRRLHISLVRIITDTTNCLPPELIKKYEILVVPVGLVIEGKFYRDMVDMTPADFWKIFPDLKDPPSTNAANPGDFLTAFEEAGKSSPDILCILVSKALTATFESAYQARRTVRNDHPEFNIEIIDSHTSAGALGFIVLEAARAAQEGKSLEEVMEVTQDMISRVIYLSALDTLKYMIRLGRAPRNSSGIGEIFNVKPIVGFIDDSGLTEVIARVRGKQKSLEKLVDLVDKYVDTRKPLHFLIHYSNCKEDAEELQKLVIARYKKYAELYVTEYSPTMATHTGPIVGMAFYS
jgi:DegV family protein with EDD domain